MDLTLSEEQLMITQTVRDFAQNEVKPVSRELDAKVDPIDCFSWELVKKAGKPFYSTTNDISIAWLVKHPLFRIYRTTQTRSTRLCSNFQKSMKNYCPNIKGSG